MITSQIHTIISTIAEDFTQSWTNIISNPILLLMDDSQRHQKDADDNMYRNIHRPMRSKIRIAINEWLKRKCNEIEQTAKSVSPSQLARECWIM